MLLLIPFILGLLACLPVPIGDPERSRIDPTISGVWVYMEGDERRGFYAFEPFDKRAWLLAGIESGSGNDKVAFYKGWLTKLAGEHFMTWEPKGVYDNETFTPEVWFVFRIERPDPDTLELWLVDGDNEVFKGVEETRRAYERVLKKNVRNADIYDEDPTRMIRLTPEDRSLFEERADKIISSDF